MGDHSHMYSVCLAMWSIGSIPSIGDVTLAPNLIAKQVSQLINVTTSLFFSIWLQLTDSEAKFVLFSPDFDSMMKEAIDCLDEDCKPRSFCFGDSKWCPDILQVRMNEENLMMSSCASANLMNETAAVFWSSGTTGCLCFAHHCQYSNTSN